MTDEELAKLDEARGREATALYYEGIGRISCSRDIRTGRWFRPEIDEVATTAARLAREGWMPLVDPRLEAAREIIVRFSAIRDFPGSASLWRDTAKDTPNDKAALTYIASCLPEGYSIADLPPVPE